MVRRVLPLLVLAALSGCIEDATFSQSTGVWVEPGLWDAAADATGVPGEWRDAPGGPPTTPVPWPGLEAGRVSWLTLSGRAGALPVAVAFTAGEPLHACIRHDPQDPDVWAVAWGLLQNGTDLAEDEDEDAVRGRLDGDGCVTLDARVLLDRLEPTRVRPNLPGTVQVAGDGFAAQVVADARTFVLEGPDAQVLVDAMDHVEVVRLYDLRRAEELPPDAFRSFVLDAFARAGLPAPEHLDDALA